MACTRVLRKETLQELNTDDQVVDGSTKELLYCQQAKVLEQADSLHMVRDAKAGYNFSQKTEELFQLHFQQNTPFCYLTSQTHACALVVVALQHNLPGVSLQENALMMCLGKHYLQVKDVEIQQSVVGPVRSSKRKLSFIF